MFMKMFIWEICQEVSNTFKKHIKTLEDTMHKTNKKLRSGLDVQKRGKSDTIYLSHPFFFKKITRTMALMYASQSKPYNFCFFISFVRHTFVIVIFINI